MSGVVIPNLTVISLCESTTGWTAVGGTISLNDPTVFDARQGTYCLQNYAAAAGNRGADYDFGVDTDLSDTVLYLWFAFSKVPHPTNYMRIRVTDSAGNWGEWNLFNKSMLPHLSWICWALQTSIPFDQTSATPPNMFAIRKIGWRMDSVAAKVYIYWDAWRYGTGLTIYGGSENDPATFEDLYLADADNAYGVIEKYNGVYYVQGKIYIGSTTDGNSTYFKDLNKVVVFKDARVKDDFYEIKLQGNSVASTTVYFGDPVSETSGIFISSASSSRRYKLDASADPAGGMVWKFSGCTFHRAREVILPTYSDVRKVVNCSFQDCGLVEVNTCEVTKTNFVSARDKAVRISSQDHHVTDCRFINNNVAIWHDIADVTLTYYNLFFENNITDVYVSTTSGTLTINVAGAGGPDPNKIVSEGAEVIVNNVKRLTLSGLKPGSEVRIYDSSTGEELGGVESSGTSFIFEYNYQPDRYVDIVVHHLNYIYVRICNYLLPDVDTVLPISQQIDRQYVNP